MELFSMTEIFRQKKAFWIVFFLPRFLVFVYFFLIASRQYVSEAPIIVYKGGSGAAAQSVNLTGSGMSLEGVVLVKEHMQSWDAFAKLNSRKLEAGWSEGDFVSRYGGLLDLFQRSPTKLWHYYQGHVEPVIDEESGVLKLKVTGYDRKFVKEVAQAVLMSSAAAVNRLKEESLNKSVENISGQLAQNTAALDNAIKRYSALKRANGIADPAAAYSSRLTQMNEVKAKIADLDSQISIVQSSVPNSAQLANLISERRGLTAKSADIDRDVRKLVRIVGDIDSVQNEIRSGEAQVAAAQAQKLAAQQEALNSRYFVAVISPPNEPVDSTEPARLFWTLVVMAASFVIYLIVK